MYDIMLCTDYAVCRLFWDWQRFPTIIYSLRHPINLSDSEIRLFGSGNETRLLEYVAWCSAVYSLPDRDVPATNSNSRLIRWRLSTRIYRCCRNDYFMILCGEIPIRFFILWLEYDLMFNNLWILIFATQKLPCATRPMRNFLFLR